MLRSARAVAILALVTCAGALVAAACSSSYSEATATDAGSDASDEAAPSAVADPCAHVGLPSPPANDDAPGTTLPAFALAFKSNADAGVDPGFDLDGVCTCETRPGTAHDGGESCARPKGTAPSCDSDGGVDNSLANLFDTFGSFYPLATVTGDQIDRGRSNTIVQIADYNGAANDPDVSVAMLASEGIKVQGCPTSTLDPALSTWSPGWCGNDAWTVTPESVIGGGNGKTPVVLGRGFVKDRVLVAQLDGAPRMPFTDEYAVPISAPILVGTLVPLGEDLQPRDPARAPVGREPRLWAIEGGRLAGRIATRELATGIGVTKVDGDGGLVQLCATPGFIALKKILCSSPDVTMAKALDFDPTAVCDGLSAGIPFTAGPVLVGDVFARTRKPGPCDPGPTGDPLDAGTVTYGCP